MTEVIPSGHEPHLFCFGLGYTARALAARLMAEGWAVSGTCRDEETRTALADKGIRAFLFDRERPLDDPAGILSRATDILSSVPPDADGDPVLDCHGEIIAAMSGLRWIGYLSTTGVYGDTGGARVNETSPVNPSSARSRRRVGAENQWLELYWKGRLPVHLFRLAGIYGPGRSTLDQVRAGRARRIDRPGHLFSRIHVDDIVTVLRTSMARPRPGAVYNVCDDVPAAPSDVVAYACELLGVKPPHVVTYGEAVGDMSAMALSFWNDNRTVDNSRMKRELEIKLAYPDFKAGLKAVHESDSMG